MAKCWRCSQTFFINPATGNCLYCGYPQDIDYVLRVKIAQRKHDLTGANPQSSGNDRDYVIKRKWSMKDFIIPSIFLVTYWHF
jgi:ribosomal protein L37E